jgi:hypothetical protein
MARLHQNGFEQNSTKEFTAVGGAGATIQAGVLRTGVAAGKIALSGQSGTRNGFVIDFAAAGNGPFFARVYFRVDTLPSAANRIIAIVNSNTISSTPAAYITIDNAGLLRLFADTGQVGSASSALTLGQWYRLEIKYDKSPAGGSQILEAKIDGSTFATSSVLTFTNQGASLIVGGNLNAEAQTTGVWYYDDIAINDSTGSQQTGYPGDGAILHTLPNGAGDNTQWTKGGSSPAATNYQSVNEQVPDDAITLVSDNTTGHIDDYTVSSISGLSSGDNINAVAVGLRFTGVGAGASSASIAARLKAASGGTTDQGSTIASNGTTWFSHTSSGLTRLIYNLVKYFLPGTSTPWTKTDLNSAQIGIKTVGANTSASQLSSIWLSVDFTHNTIAPTVVTNAASSVLGVSATGNGNVTSDGGDAITERGIVWGTSVNPTTASNLGKVTAAGTTGVFTGSMTGLTPATTYHYRAYAINGIGTSYGADTTFTTLSLGAINLLLLGTG